MDISNIKLYNAVGSLVLSSSLTGKEIKIPLSNVSTGIYIVNLKYDNKYISRKILLSR